MLTLRPLETADVAVIQDWPVYPPEFADLDYALRGNGWVAEFRNDPASRIYVAEQDGELIAFTLLAGTGASEAEFRIALRADRLGQGLGKALTAMTLEKGFAELQLARIHLIVRKNNLRAINLYKNIGFVERGECQKDTNNKLVSYWEMSISRDG